MKPYRIKVSVVHRAKTTPHEVQACTLDYGHEWVFNKAIFFRDFDASKYEIISPMEHKINATLVLLGFIKLPFQQTVSVVPGQSVSSSGTNMFGYPVSSVWDLKEAGNGITEVTATYVMDVPWFLAFLELPFRWLWTYIRNKSWESDRVMLERRSELLNLGFKDQGVYPRRRWMDQAKPSVIPVGL